MSREELRREKRPTSEAMWEKMEEEEDLGGAMVLKQ